MKLAFATVIAALTAIALAQGSEDPNSTRSLSVLSTFSPISHISISGVGPVSIPSSGASSVSTTVSTIVSTTTSTSASGTNTAPGSSITGGSTSTTGTAPTGSTTSQSSNFAMPTGVQSGVEKLMIVGAAVQIVQAMF